MEIKLSRLKQIISEVVEERHASGRMDDIIQSTRGEEVDPHDQALDEMIAEEAEAAMEQFVVSEDEGAEATESGLGAVPLDTSDGKNLRKWARKINTLPEWADFFKILEVILGNEKIMANAKRFATEAEWSTVEYQRLIQLMRQLLAGSREEDEEAGAGTEGGSSTQLGQAMKKQK